MREGASASIKLALPDRVRERLAAEVFRTLESGPVQCIRKLIIVAHEADRVHIRGVDNSQLLQLARTEP
ncbi:hypothetical protein [Nocardia sp. NPDC058480]|uniref:hypothetical protein n=1 Tax=unclassified Nocardia TaxID=2637762 RepID=UPI00365ABFBB